MEGVLSTEGLPTFWTGVDFHRVRVLLLLMSNDAALIFEDTAAFWTVVHCPHVGVLLPLMSREAAFLIEDPITVNTLQSVSNLLPYSLRVLFLGGTLKVA